MKSLGLLYMFSYSLVLAFSFSYHQLLRVKKKREKIEDRDRERNVFVTKKTSKTGRQISQRGYMLYLPLPSFKYSVYSTYKAMEAWSLLDHGPCFNAAVFGPSLQPPILSKCPLPSPHLYSIYSKGNRPCLYILAHWELPSPGWTSATEPSNE